MKVQSLLFNSKMIRASKWLSFPCPLEQIDLSKTLKCGQSFRWFEVSKGEWRSVLSNRVFSLKQDAESISFQIHEKASSIPQNRKRKASDEVVHLELDNDDEKKLELILREYFQLNVDLKNLYQLWCDADPNFSVAAKSHPGVRVLRQDPVENLFSFICSSNNNISRITGMIEKLCSNYGQFLVNLDGKDYYTFPEVDVLAKDGVEVVLREMGFGYRAKFIQKSAQECLKNGGREWLLSLRSLPYEEARKQLITLPGVGPKVSDCICLMSLDKTNAVPVDTHVWQIAKKMYMKSLSDKKSVTDKTYKEIVTHFQSLWGEYAGWAHSVMPWSQQNDFFISILGFIYSGLKGIPIIKKR